MAAINAHSAIIVLACMSLCGCFSLGTTRLYEDRLGYSRALGDAEKSDTLLNVVRLRYADTPIVLQATQVISGYQLQRNVTGGFEAFPAGNPSTFLNGNASAQFQQSPTFTFQPLSGAQFAQSFIRPLSPGPCRRLTCCRSLWAVCLSTFCSGWACSRSTSLATWYR